MMEQIRFRRCWCCGSAYPKGKASILEYHHPECKAHDFLKDVRQ